MPFPMNEPEEYDVPRVPNPPSLGLWMIVGIPLVLIVATTLALLWVLPDLRGGASSKKTIACLSNLSELAQATALYATDHDDTIPSDKWNDRLQPYLRKIPDSELLFACPVQRRLDPESSGYAMSNRATGKKMKTIGSLPITVLIFDSHATLPSAVSDPDDTPYPGRHEHGRKNNVAYADGHTKSIPAIEPH